MAFAISQYQDTYSERRKPSADSIDGKWQLGRFNWVDSEQEAKDFIIRRARIALEDADAEVRRARKRLAKVVKKFGAPCKHGIDDPEQCGYCDDERQSAAKES